MTVIDIRIELKKGVADPEGSNTMKTLESLGFKGIRSVKSVKTFVMDLDMPAEEAKKAAKSTAGGSSPILSFRATASP